MRASGAGGAFVSTLASAPLRAAARLRRARSLLPYALYRCLLAALASSPREREHDGGAR